MKYPLPRLHTRYIPLWIELIVWYVWMETSSEDLLRVNCVESSQIYTLNKEKQREY